MPLTQQNIRGVKRRRLDDKGSEEDKEAKLRRKLHHALRELRKVVKKTKTFEVQKTLKKLKEARRKDLEGDVTRDLGAQLEVLKHLNYDQLAHSVLMTKLKKDKIISADPSIQAISLELPSNLVSPGMPGTSTAKVQSRILSSKVLASEVVSIVETLRTFLHPSARSEDVGETTDNPRASPDDSKRRKTGREKDAFSFKDNVTNPSGEWSYGGHENTNDDEAITEVDGGWESGTLGAPSGSDGSVPSADDCDPSSDDPNDVTFGRGSGDESGPSENPKNKKSQPHGSRGQSEFLPSLSVGFARGDSGSEFSDSETKFVDGIKKNRRGQRARRAIWEKKFGKNANHMKKRREQETVRRSRQLLPDSVRVDRRSAKANSSSQTHRTPTQSRAPTHGHEQVCRPGPEGAKNSGSIKGQPERTLRKGDLRENPGERPLHPSWEAKRKQQAVSIMPSQGTKIVFSES